MIAALDKDAVNVGFEIERLRSTAKILKMRITPALHVPVASPDSNADCIIHFIGKQRFQLIAPALAILRNRERKIRTQQVAVVAGKPDVRQDGAFKVKPPPLGQRKVRVETDA